MSPRMSSTSTSSDSGASNDSSAEAMSEPSSTTIRSDRALSRTFASSIAKTSSGRDVPITTRPPSMRKGSISRFLQKPSPSRWNMAPSNRSSGGRLSSSRSNISPETFATARIRGSSSTPWSNSTAVSDSPGLLPTIDCAAVICRWSASPSASSNAGRSTRSAASSSAVGS